MDTERHIIRHMHGRRREQMSPRELMATRNSKQPVVLTGGWMEISKEEVCLQENVFGLFPLNLNISLEEPMFVLILKCMSED